MRFGIAPNVRVQDGLKQRLLCDACEGRMSVWESAMAQSLFRPYHRGKSAEIPYGPWLAKFCSSVAWRVLFIHKGLGLDNFKLEQLALVDRALDAWKDFMFDRILSPGDFEFHLLPVDVLSNFERPGLPSNINRYLTRAVEMDVVRNDESAFVYVKICKFIIMGFIQMPRPREWEGTKVEIAGSIVSPSRYSLPGQFGDYLLERARRMAQMQANISTRQKERIAETMRLNLDRVASSDSLNAMHHDVLMFGDSAFENPEE
jgi:hypothetical protein